MSRERTIEHIREALKELQAWSRVRRERLGSGGREEGRATVTVGSVV
jgi:hypothetical protein